MSPGRGTRREERTSAAATRVRPRRDWPIARRPAPPRAERQPEGSVLLNGISTSWARPSTEQRGARTRPAGRRAVRVHAPTEKAVADAREIDAGEFLPGAKRNREDEQAPEHATRSSIAASRRGLVTAGIRAPLPARRLVRRLQTRRVPNCEPKRNPEYVRHLAHHQGIAHEAGDKKGDQPGGDTRQGDVAGLRSACQITSAGASENPQKQPKADEAQLRAEAEEIIVGIHAPLPQRAQLGRRKLAGEEKNRSMPTPNSGRVPITRKPARISSTRTDQRLPGHLSSDIAAAHPGVTDDHHREREDSKYEDASNRCGLCRITGKTRTTSPTRVAAMTERGSGEVERSDERHTRRDPEPDGVRGDAMARPSGRQPAQREVRPGSDVVRYLRRDSQSDRRLRARPRWRLDCEGGFPPAERRSSPRAPAPPSASMRSARSKNAVSATQQRGDDDDEREAFENDRARRQHGEITRLDKIVAAQELEQRLKIRRGVSNLHQIDPLPDHGRCRDRDRE